MNRYTCRYCFAFWETTFLDQFPECLNCGNVNQRKIKRETIPAIKPKDQIDVWLQIGKGNSWICKSWDPQFNRESFFECTSIEELSEIFSRGYWTLGAAFHYKNICFINQVKGGSEWLTIKDDFAFESLSMRRILKEGGTAILADYIDRFQKADREKLINFDY